MTGGWKIVNPHALVRYGDMADCEELGVERSMSGLNHRCARVTPFDLLPERTTRLEVERKARYSDC